MTRHQRSRRGVSFLELLIVMAVIALLMSIILPALPYGRDEAIKIQCMNNLRQIMAVATIYSHDDSKGVVGPVHPKGHLYVGDGYADYAGGPGAGPGMGWDGDFDPQTRPLNRLIYGKTGVVKVGSPGDSPRFELFQCPGTDLGWQRWPGFEEGEDEERPYFTSTGTSYRMNNLHYSDVGSVGVHGRPLTRIPDPGATIAFMEARVYQTVFTNNAWGTLEHGELEGYHRIRAFFNVAYADGRVDFANFGNSTYYQHMEWLDNPEWVGLDVRGTWGRMDCLPDPPIVLD